MADLIRFGVSIDAELVEKFDSLIKKENYSNRSESIRDLIREKLVKKEWLSGKSVAGTITLVYDHHKRELLNMLADIQHDFYHLIISSQHVHLDHDNCLEIIIVKGRPKEIQDLANKLRAIKGVKHGQLTTATTGKEL
ncbi:MAG: nickel-responsive transcriptional regulator NikR [Candidatus Omnitrophota bacterium]